MAGEADFGTYGAEPVENVYPEASSEFLYWQSREAALATLETWEKITARKLTVWQQDVGGRILPIETNAGDQIEATYDRTSLSFFQHTRQGLVTRTAESVDIVAHETGHALLDAARPSLWHHPLEEIAAFHEAFGDCMALLTGLADSSIRSTLLQQSPDLSAPNALEAIGEALAVAMLQEHGPGHPASSPRHARNTFRFAVTPGGGSQSLPPGDPHRFSQIFTGCFYDLILAIFNASPGGGADDLWAAATAAGELLFEAVRVAPKEPRFFSAVGSTMLKLDGDQNQGAHRAAILQAFGNHQVAVSADVMFAPLEALEGTAPQLPLGGGVNFAPAARLFSSKTLHDLKKRMRIPSEARLFVKVGRIGRQELATAVYRQAVSLATLGREFRDCTAQVPRQVTIGVEEKGLAIVRPVAASYFLEREVQRFVSALLEHGRVEVSSRLKNPKQGVRRKKTASHSLPTHRIFLVRGQRRLERVRFSCGCSACV